MAKHKRPWMSNAGKRKERMRREMGEPPTDVQFRGPELMERFQRSWTEWLTIRGYSVGWSKAANATIRIDLESDDGEKVCRWIPYSGVNKNGHHNSGFLLDVMLAADVPPALTSIVLQEGESPLDAIFDAVIGQRVLCEMEWAKYQGMEYPTIRRFVERPGRKPPAPTPNVVALEKFARPGKYSAAAANAPAKPPRYNAQGLALSNNGNVLPKEHQRCEDCGVMGARHVQCPYDAAVKRVLCDDCECPK